MIRQYITLAVVVLIAAFVASQIEWGEMPGQYLNGDDNRSSANFSGVGRPLESRMSTGDLRTGGISRSPRQKSPRATFSPRSGVARNKTASSTSLVAATSTSLRSGVNKRDNLDGIRAQFSENSMISESPARQSDQTKERSAKEGNSVPSVASDIRISGHVVNDSGEPIEGLALTLKLRKASIEDKAIFGVRILNAQSDAKGAYSFVNLVEGDYLLCTVESREYRSVCQNPHAPHSSADFSLHGTASARVYGTVKDEQGILLSEVTVSATPGQKNRTVTDEKGKYSLAMTANSELHYQLYFTKEDYTRERVAVTGADLLSGKELNVSMEKTKYSGFDVQGTVYDQSGSPVSGRTITLRSPTVKSSYALRAVSGSDGEFTIKYVIAADDYNLTVHTGGGYTFDSAPYEKMEIFDGMTPLRLELQSAGQGSFRAHVVSTSGTVVTGETFSLYSGSAYVGNTSSDAEGEIHFDKVPVKQGGSTLRISSGSTPKYNFSGITLAEGEHKSGVELLVDRGQNNLVLTVMDDAQTALQGARGVLTWTSINNGVRSQTSRSRGKTSIAGTGIINFSELGLGEHRLQVRLQGYMAHTTVIDITQQTQYEKVVMVKAKE